MPGTKHPRAVTLALALFLAILAISCGADSGEDASSGPAAVPTTTTSASPEQTDTDGAEESDLGDSSRIMTDLAWAEISLPSPIEATEVLSDGTVVAIGAPGSDGEPGSIYEWDPATREFREIGQLNEPRRMPMSTVLTDDRILIAGGLDLGGNVLSTSEIVTPSEGTSERAGDMETPRARAKMAPLPDGGAIITGGLSATGGIPGMSASTEIYDHADNSLTPGPDLPIGGRGELAASTLHDGRVLVTGGAGIGEPSQGDQDNATGAPVGINASAAAAIYDPSTQLFTATASMTTPRGGHAGFQVGDYLVVVAGDTGSMLQLSPTNSVEAYDPVSDDWIPLEDLPAAIAGYAGAVDSAGQLIVLSGTTDGIETTSTGYVLSAN